MEQPGPGSRITGDGEPAALERPLGASSLRSGSSRGRPALIFDRPLMRAGTYPRSGRICECSALSPVAGACRWPLLLLSAEDRPGPRQVLTPASRPRCLA
jgi:hypothetical protein